MSKFTLAIDCNGAAFEDWPQQEVANILRQARVKLSVRAGRELPNEDDPIRLYDTNGNMVGVAKFEED